MIRAMLVDDEEIALDLMEILLAEIGGVTIVGKYLHPAEALAEVEQTEPDLIFLDIEMPGMNGLAAAERLLAIRPRLKIVFVTAYHQYALDAFEVNARDYLLKPVSKERLIKSLERFNKDRSPAPQVPQTDAAASVPIEEAASPAAKLRLHVLGSMELYDAAGTLVSWRTKKTKELFALLWHHGGAPVYRLHILEALWPQLTAERAQALFHTTMYRLRKTLKSLGYPEMIHFADERYTLHCEWIESDLQKLEAAMLNVQTEPDVEKLIGLYRGDYLETEHYGWAQPRRLEQRAAFQQALENCTQQVGGHLRECIWRKLIEMEPYAESYYISLLHEMKSSGNITGMRLLYLQMKEKWKDELGMELDIEIQELLRK